MFIRDQKIASDLFARPLARHLHCNARTSVPEAKRSGSAVQVFLSTCLILGAITIALWLKLYAALMVSAAPKSWPTISLQTYVTGLSQPVAITHAGDGSNRLFITERAGKIRIYNTVSHALSTFLDLSASGANRVQSSGSEQGLLSVAFPPNYAAKGYFYVNYTNFSGPAGDTVIARYRVTADPNVADPNSEQIILTISQPEANHNGGQLQFGPDGFLYIGMGDGGGGGDAHGTIGNAQAPLQLLGKILRINVEPIINSAPAPGPSFTSAYTLYLPIVFAPAPVPPVTYTIPVTNPFVGNSSYKPEIWALGVRNPWRFSFDRQTGDLYIADVGQGDWEEVNFQMASSPGGENYGWRILEGKHCYPPGTPSCTPPSNYSAPVAEYDHASNGGPCASITGGYVYRGASYPAMQGIYFYGDYCSGKFWGLQKDGSNWVTNQFTNTPTSFSFSTFGEDQAGELYTAFYNAGTIYKITSP